MAIDLFGVIGTKTLAHKKFIPPDEPAERVYLMPRPGKFLTFFPKQPVQTAKDYKPITTLAELEEYLKRCEDTGLCGFDYETAASKETHARYHAKVAQLTEELTDKKALEAALKTAKQEFLESPLDPWQAEICTVSLSAAANEARVVFISNKPGANTFEPHLTRDAARVAAFDTIERLLFKNRKITKIAVNLAFETKMSAALGKYILSPVADPLIMWVRCLQVVNPEKIKDPKKPASGKGLKPITKEYFGVTMGEFLELLKKHSAEFFDEISADHIDALVYSAEDADYALQHYLFWREVAQQIPRYYEWLHEIEMPFTRVIGLMEYWGMKFDDQIAVIKEQEAEIKREQAAAQIRKIAKETCDIEVDPGLTGKTGDVQSLLWDSLKLPIAKRSDKTNAPSLDEEALIDMTFMLEHNLKEIEEEVFLSVELPADWQEINLDTAILASDVRRAIEIARREPHPYKEQGLKLLAEIQNMQTYTTLMSAHIIGRAKYLNPASGRIHAGYTQWTETSRLNSFRPNGQNVPRMDNDVFGIRNLYVAPSGRILFFIDFSGFELRLMAWRSGDEVMILAFKNGEDLHKKTAVVLTGKTEDEITKAERNSAKAGNFGIAYGGTEWALQATFKKDYGIRRSLDECAAIVNAVKTAYPRIPEYQRSIVLEAREKGYVQTIYGYIRMLPKINSGHSGDRRGDERRAGNTPIQGSAADVMKRCQNEVYEAIGTGHVLQHGKTDMIAQIHDEIVFEMDDDPTVVKQACEFIKSIMEKPPLPDFPVDILAEASVGYRWGEKVSVEEWLEKRETDGKV
jgi:DNA polymerase-1